MKLIRKDMYKQQVEQEVLPYLETIKGEGFFQGFDGNPLKWYSYGESDAGKTLVIVHGFTESARKYAEIIWYFVKAGFRVYIYDQRGHGESFRHVEDLTLTHVNRFEDYVEDLEQFLEQVVPKDLPLCLYSHSMGGAVSALFLEKHPDVFEKAVLSSPMIAPDRGGFPLFISKLVCGFFILIGKGRERIFLSGEYPGEEKFEDSCATSVERFARYEALRRINPVLQNCAPTYRWTLESLKVTAKILKKGMPERVKTPVLLCSAGRDTVVINSEQDKLAERLPNCTHKVYDAKHEVFNGEDEVMEAYVKDVLEFL